MRLESLPARLVREYPAWVDAAVVGFALLCSASSMWYVDDLAGLPTALVLNGPPPLALAWRRRAPRAVLAVILGFALVQWALAVPYNGVQVSALIAVYTVARYESQPTARYALGAVLALVAIAPLRQPFAGLGNGAMSAGLVVVAYLIGSNVGLRQEYLRALEERAERLERERDAAAEVAAVLERTRIARELHDVVAHHVSVMVVQAEGAGWAIETRPDVARTAVATIADTGRSTLIELRRLLGVLRAGDEDGTAPQPGLADLPALIEGFRGSGLTVVLAAEPAPSAPDREPSGSATELTELTGLPESLQLAAFRIVQEGLTNVLKHAGAAAQARVAVGVVHQAPAAAELLVEISDDGIGPGGRANARSDPGHGLIGIRERVELFGGRAEIGPGSGRGFSVRARFPLPVDQPA